MTETLSRLGELSRSRKTQEKDLGWLNCGEPGNITSDSSKARRWRDSCLLTTLSKGISS
jgi:hypothetical protein